MTRKLNNLENMVGSDFEPGDACPVHGTPHRKVYTFGSSMSTETEVCTFKGCRCAVAVRHDCCGVLQFDPIYCTSYEAAAGVGRIRRDDTKARFGRGYVDPITG